jgi:hypothetical protein
MEFFIRKNSTLPILEIDLFKDGKLDYNYKDSIFSSSTITFEMKDVDTDFYRITNGTCTYSIEDQTIYYQFTKKIHQKSEDLLVSSQYKHHKVKLFYQPMIDYLLI